MESSDPSKTSVSLNEIMYRRLKNRERQRRYRERKRLRINNSKGRTKKSSQMQIVSLPVNVPIEQAVTRVHCKRDWKKDARKAHTINHEAKSSGLPSNGMPSAGDKQIPHFVSGTHETGQTGNGEVPFAGMNSSEKASNKKRNWKAEARNKRI